MRRFALHLFLVCLLALSLPAAAKDRVWVVMSGEDGVYAETATVLRNELEGEATLKFGVPAKLLDTQEAPPTLIVTVGTVAFDTTHKWLSERYAIWGHVPVLATLLPRSAYDARVAEVVRSGRVMSAVVLDQPIGRQMALIKRVLPNWLRVGVLMGPQTRLLLPQLEQQARLRDLRLVASPAVDSFEQTYPALKGVFESADVLLALPDQLLYNSSSLQNILLASYRARVPLVAFSPAYVKAGALMAVYTTPTQVAFHTAGVVRGWLAGRGLPPVQPPREFDVVVNTAVANSLGLRIDGAAQIVEDLRRDEARQ
ncbi:MAG: ABC transporter substrate binding protein [Rhodocyclaceae bacterium]|nr:ABC transporter substrate binding protein [Rhodocyclaceae bacterium]MDZ4215889.1 ABC transporter substrate binding protein [Rhodocyclaceae bacterium]